MGEPNIKTLNIKSANHALVNLALSYPQLSQTEYQLNPYSLIETFFNYTTPFGYRKHLSLWFKSALSEGISHPKPIELIFLYNQYQSLINAGYLIAVGELPYQPKPRISDEGKLFGDWLLNMSGEIQFGEQCVLSHELQLLSEDEKNNPVAFCRNILTLETITSLHFGMKEWFEAALTENDSIACLDHEHLFDMFELLQKITEAFYMIIISPVLGEKIIKPNS